MFKPEELKILKEAKNILRSKQVSFDGDTDAVLLHTTVEGLAELIDPTYVGIY